MWKFCLAILAVMAFSGCASPVPPEPMAALQQRQAASLRHQVDDMQALIDGRRQRLKASTDPTEREELQKDLSDMGQQLARLQQRLSEETGSAPRTPQAAASATSSPGAGSTGGTYIGPRGGCYKLTRSGKKNYSAC